MKYIGIDPALRKKGTAVCILHGSTAYFHKIEDEKHFREIMPYPYEEDLKICIENSYLQKAIWGKGKRVQNVKANQGFSEALYWGLILCYGSGKVIQVSPKEKGAKWDERVYTSLLRAEKIVPVYVGKKGKKSSQDERDALKLALLAQKRDRIERKIDFQFI